MRRLLIGLLLFAGASGMVRAQDATPPLSKSDILGRLAAGSSPSYIAHLVKTRGISFTTDDDFLKATKNAGGDGVLMSRLRDAPSGDEDSSRANNNDTLKHLAECAHLERSGTFDKAEKECRAAMDADPQNPFPLLATGHCVVNRMKPSDAVSLGRKAADLAPQSAEVHIALASFFNAEGNGYAAQDEVREAVRLEPEELDALLLPPNLVMTQVRDRQQGVAAQVEYLEGLLRVEMDFAAARRMLANDLLQQGKADDALREARQAADLEPGVAQSHVAIANILELVALKSEKTPSEDAAKTIIAELRAAVEIEPMDCQSRELLGNTLELVKDVDGAIAEYKECLRLIPTIPTVHSDLADLYDRTGRLDDEIQEMRRYIANSPPLLTEYARLDFARVLQKAGQLGEAAAECKEILREDPDNPLVHDQLGGIRSEQGYLPDALYEFSAAVALGPDQDDYHLEMANTLDLLARPEDAISQFRIVLERSPDHAWAHNDIAWFYATTKNLKYRDPKAAISEAKKAVQLSEEREPGIFDTLAEAYFSNRQFDEAITTETRAIELDPDNLQLQHQLARFKRHDINSPPATE
jgi:tetratricopeptide (TPR) repeat protein